MQEERAPADARAAFLAARIRAPVAKKTAIADKPVVVKDFFGRVVGPQERKGKGEVSGVPETVDGGSNSSVSAGPSSAASCAAAPAKPRTDSNRVWFRFHEVSLVLRAESESGIEGE